MTQSPGKQATEGQFDDYHRLVDKVDRHAARTSEAHGARIACGARCTGCCHRDLTVFPVEAAVIRTWLADHPLAPEAAPTLPGAATLQLLDLGDAPSPCALLGADGLCRIYPVRPLICRTHGLPLAIEDDDGLYADVCPLSFEGGAGLADLEEADFLVVDTLNAILAAVNGAHVAATGASARRVSLRELAESGAVSWPGGSPGSA